MTDEDVIRRRLLIDGDGIGDDRRINVLLKSFIKWADTPEVDVALHERILSQLAACEFAQKKSRLVSAMNEEELKNYESLSNEIELEITNARLSIEKTKIELIEAKKKRKNKTDYDALARIIEEQPDREMTNLKLAALQKELAELKQKLEKLENKLETRKKQFHLLISTIHSLESLLEESDNEMDVEISENSTTVT